MLSESSFFEEVVDEGGTVLIGSERRNGNVRIRVSNTGSRISSEQVSHVFDRFWRGDSARKKNGTHCGIGLSLCKAIVDQLDGEILAESTSGGSFSITVLLSGNVTS